MKFFYKLILPCFFLHGAGCMNHYTPKHDGQLQKYQIIRESNFSEKSQSTLDGTGWIIFKRPLEGKQSPNLFNLSFILETNESRLDLVLYNTDIYMNDGLHIHFSREQDVLRVQFGPAYQIPIDISSFFYNKEKNEPFHFFIAVYHDNMGLRVLFWTPRQKIITIENAIFDSRTQGLPLINLHGGTNWGLKLYQAHVFKANVTNYYVK